MHTTPRAALFCAAIIVATSLAPATAHSQGWPDAGYFGGIGGGLSADLWGYGFTGGITRRYGRVFGSLLGEALLRPDRNTASGYEWGISAPGAIPECIDKSTQRRIDPSYCAQYAHMTVAGAAMAETGLVFESETTTLLGVGYRGGSGSGPYGMVAFAWPFKNRQELSFFTRIAAGAHFVSMHAGIAVEMR